MTRIAEDPTKAILSESKLHEKHLCDYVINVATGCRHGCVFCYVPGTPNIRTRGEMLNETVGVEDGQEEWGDYVLYRDDIPDRLPGILERKRIWKETENGCGIVGVSFHTDCFMDKRAAEITTSVIETLAEHERYCRILTRNPMLAANYMETFEAAGQYVTIGSSIPTLHEDRVNAVEPDAPPIASRLRGLRRFAHNGISVFVSMSPTYPTIGWDRAMEELLQTIGSLDPSVVFHEPINPRGSNFAMTVAAAEQAGQNELADALTEIQGPKAWLRYACQHFAWVQRSARKLDIPVHLWPDKQLVNIAPRPEQTWLQHWRDRQSPERFADRDTPDTPPMEPPPLFTWEARPTQTTLSGGEL